jgi:nucleotide-binding universal stress UspA family protein
MMAITRILVPVDFGALSARALEYARELAVKFDASLDLLHVVPNPYLEPVSMYSPLPPQFLDDLVSEATKLLDEALPPAERSRFKASCVVKVGDPRNEVIAYAHAAHIDLIVMGTHGRTGMAHLFLGSVAERVVQTAPCPVLTVR